MKWLPQVYWNPFSHVDIKLKKWKKLFFLWWELLGLVLLTAFVYNIELYML